MSATEVKEPQFRHVCLTLNNYSVKEYEELIATKCSYLVVGKEVGEQGTPHLQAYIEFGGGKRLSTLKKMWPRAHIEKRKGTAEQAATYCKKDNNFIETGEITTQGQRTDLITIKTEIMEGKKSVQDIRQEDPFFFHQYGRTLNTLEDDFNRTQFRTERTQGFWLQGATGTGKSHIWKTNFLKNPDLFYVWKLRDKGWQDGYKQQPFVIIDDFRGKIEYDEMLTMIDDTPAYSVSRRGREPIPFTSKVVIITSSLSPEEVYNRRHEKDDIAQLNRRIKTFKLPDEFENATEVLGVILQPSSSHVAKKLP